MKTGITLQQAANAIIRYEQENNVRVVIKNAHRMEKERKELPRSEVYGYAFEASEDMRNMTLAQMQEWAAESNLVMLLLPDGRLLITKVPQETPQADRCAEKGA